MSGPMNTHMEGRHDNKEENIRSLGLLGPRERSDIKEVDITKFRVLYRSPKEGGQEDSSGKCGIARTSLRWKESRIYF